MRSRQGFALLYALFMVMALSVVGLGLMATGTRETLIAAGVEGQLRARATAEAAALEAVGRWSTRAWADLAVDPAFDTVVQTPIPGATVTVARLDTTFYLLRAEGVDRTAAGREPVASARVALLVRTLDPATLAAAFPAALTATTSIDVRGGAVHGGESCPRPGGATSAPAALAPHITVDPAARVYGDPPVSRSAAPLPPAPDPFAPALAPALATVAPDGSVVTPGPLASGGRCTPGPRNWGSTDPAHPCYTHLPFVHHTGRLTMVGGEGRGILVVDGDAHLTADARFHGLLIVHGRLHLDGGARVAGAIRARTIISQEAEIRHDGCAIHAALLAPSLDRAFRSPGRWWVAAF